MRKEKANVVLLGESTGLLNSLKKKESLHIVNFEKVCFSNDNLLYQLNGNNNIQTISIVADLSSKLHENLWGLILSLDFFKKKKINIDKLIFPYLPYSRSNKVSNNNTKSLQTLICHINKYKVGELVVLDPHFGNQKLFSTNKIIIVEQKQIFEPFLKNNLGYNLILGPDEGSKERVCQVSTLLNIEGFTFNKKRRGHKEEVKIKVAEQIRNYILKSDKLLIMDDEICSGETLKNTIKEIKLINSNLIIDVYITHNFMRRIDEEVFKSINNFYTTNSIENKLRYQKINIVNLSRLIEDVVNYDIG